MTSSPDPALLAEPIDLADPDAIDLDGHAVIEASAGTGKTYTIERLVRRLVCEKGIRLDQILIVTFTEKATGELKDRVRAALEQALATGAGRDDLLQQALDAYDEAPVFTIHGFCQRILKEYAFENRQPFYLELVDDAELLERRLREVQRRVWPRLYGKGLEALLEISGYPDLDDGESSWEQRVTRLARTYKPHCDDKLRPAPLADIAQRLETAERRAAAALHELIVLLEPVPAQVETHSLYQGHQELNIYQKEKDECAQLLLVPLLQMVGSAMATPRDDAPALLGFARLLSRCKSDTVSGGFASLITPTWRKVGKPNPQACPQLGKVGKILADLCSQVDWPNLAVQLTVTCVQQLQEDIAAFKLQNGQISFDDLLVRLRDALDPALNPAADVLLAALRGRFRYALVDEFQDTDAVQWQIFRRIFVQGTKYHRLMVIGDPKQAIYAFRGADVHTYLAARDHLCAGQAGYYSLPTNYRSHPELLAALNCVFKDGQWFQGASITYRPVHEPKKCKARIYRDTTGRPPLTLVDLPDIPAGGEAHHQFARFVAMEVQRLLAAGPDGRAHLIFEGRNGVESLNPGHICVLVRSRRESYFIEKYLRERQVPCAFYKKPGLWQSAEARHLAFLLRAIAGPEDVSGFKRALLTRFFHVSNGDGYGPIPLADLNRSDGLPPSHPIRRLLAKWRDWAGQREWPRLFESILHETGILLDESREGDARRRIANHRHLLQNLLEMAAGGNLDIRGLADLVQRLRSQSESGGNDEDDLHRVESEKPAVQIITIHKAKGLEFPVVFVAGGFTKGGSSSYFKFHENGIVVYDLTSAPQSEAAAAAEEDEENRRLFYVALTRPMYKLYLPRFNASSGQPGPITNLVFSALDKSKPEVTWPHTCRRVTFDGRSIAEPGAEGKPLEPKLDPLPTEPQITQDTVIAVENLFPPVVSFRDRGVQLMSFTSLSSRSAQPEPVAARFSEEGQPSEEEGAAIPRVTATPGGLPFGSVSGTLLHSVFQRLDFSKAARAENVEAFLADADVVRLLDQQIREYFPATLDGPRLQDYRADAGRLLWQTLRTPLMAPGRLCDLASVDRLHELQFYYPLNGVGEAGKTIDIADVQVCRGNYLFGVIDLVFRRGGRYFLLDFKSNVLDGGYGTEQIRRSMAEHRYDLQYQLYTLALVRWLKQIFGVALDLETHFGGVYYLYLRGMNESDETTGVFHCRPTSHDINHYEAKIAGLLDTGGPA